MASERRSTTGGRAGISVLRWAGRIVVLAALVSVLAAATVLTVIPATSNGAALTVLSGSMSPTIPVGSVVVVRPIDPMTLEEGDVATYQPDPDEPVFVTHRVLKVDRSGYPATFTFQGDANAKPDPDLVPSTAIRGEMWFHVPYLGAIRDAFHGAAGLVALVVLALGGYAMAQVYGAVQDRRRRLESERDGDESGDGVRMVTPPGPLVVATVPVSLANVEERVHALTELGASSVRVIEGPAVITATPEEAPAPAPASSASEHDYAVA